MAQEGLEYQVPIKLSSETNSEAEEAAVFVSPNGETLYFSRILHISNTGGIKGGQDIWSSTADGKGGWLMAERNLLELNNKGDNAVIGVSEDGNTLYLLNKYRGNRTSMGVSFTTREGDQWSAPKTLKIPGLISNSGFYGFNMNPTGEYLIISMNSGATLGEEDLYVSMNEGGTWSDPLHLGPVINSTGYEITPFLAADTKSIYFSSNGRGGYGDADIYKSDRLDDTWTNWSEPINMGEPINSAGFDVFFSITPSNRIFFCSNRSGMLSDIFESSVLETYVEEDQLEADDTELASILTEEEGATKFEGNAAEIEKIAVGQELEEYTDPAVEEVNIASTEENRVSVEEPVSSKKEEEPVLEEAIPVENDKTSVEKANLETVTSIESTNGTSEVAVAGEEIAGQIDDEASELPLTQVEEPLVSEASVRREVASAGLVYFEPNSSYFSKEEAVKLKLIYDKLTSHPSLNLEVLGYSDNLGKELYNMWISERRVNRVIQYLINKGISSDRMSGKWFGEANPVSHCTVCDEQEHQKNRRVELMLQ